MAEMVKVYSDAEHKLAEFLVNDAGLMGPSGDGNRLSGGHGWHRRTKKDEQFFLELAERLLGDARSLAYEHYHPRTD